MFFYESNRTFVVFSYNANHGLLLLRSQNPNEHPTRVGILIQDVRAMEIRSWFSGVQIEAAGSSYLDAWASKPLEMMDPGGCVYAINGVGWDDYVVGGIARTNEDSGECSDPP